MKLYFVKTRVTYKIMFRLYKMCSSVGDETFADSFVMTGSPIARNKTVWGYREFIGPT